ncbi:MAG: aminotransferase class V-fold PLP-dependent enzyme [Porphyromonadaceae bacterium]|nr:aminotransferase class V-fold PLP-dependent enzyme [Porphyromonadaceae bacterium]
MPLLYFDNATTSYPKPPALREALASFYDQPIGSYGRSLDAATIQATLLVEELRDALASWLGVQDADRVVLCEHATFGLNTILRGYAPLRQPGAWVWISPMEHNAVMRPLAALCAQYGLRYEVMPHLPDGRVDMERLGTMPLPYPPALAIVNIESNVNGVIQPIAQIAANIHQWGVPLLCDATQCAGAMPLRIDEWGVDFVAFTGHKGLLGPSGTGGYYIRRPQEIEPLTLGGNGLHSESLLVTSEMPDRFLAGTPNLLGLTAWAAAMKQIPEYAISPQMWWDALKQWNNLPGIQLYHALEAEYQGYLFSLTHECLSPSELATRLHDRFGIIVRSGLHCAPLAHSTLGTLERGGTLRISISPYQTIEDWSYLTEALCQVLHD